MLRLLRIVRSAIGFLVLSSAPVLFTQTPAPTAPTAFDVISIHLSGAKTVVKGDVEYSFMKIDDTNDGYVAENITIKAVVADAYNVKLDDVSGGPDWVESDSYDISGKVAASDGTAPVKLTKPQRRQMLQAMLADRFKLVVHNETKNAPIYELVVARDGPKLHAFAPVNGAAGGVTGPDGRFYAGTDNLADHGMILLRGYPIGSLVAYLRSELHRPVIDKTGLTGKFDISLHWTPDNTPADSPLAGGPSIFAAIQEQLGLKLNSTKGPISTLVIDQIERPSAN